MRTIFEVVPGSVAYGKSGKPWQVVNVDGETAIVKGRDAEMKRFNLSAFLKVVPPSPRKAITHAPGRVNVDLDRLALSYQPSVPIPNWEPKAELNTHW